MPRWVRALNDVDAHSAGRSTPRQENDAATGGLFGLLTIWLIYPIIDAAMCELVPQLKARLSSPRALALGFGIPQRPISGRKQ